jgi:hypothetical protein
MQSSGAAANLALGTVAAKRVRRVPNARDSNQFYELYNICNPWPWW